MPFSGQYCDEVTTSPQLDYLALLLLIIPIVICVLLVVWYRHHRPSYKIPIDVGEAIPYVDEKSSAISTTPIVEAGAANPAADNAIYHTFSKNIALAITDKSFIGGAGGSCRSTEPLMESLETTVGLY